MRLTGLGVLLIFLVTPTKSQFALGYDFMHNTIDGRISFSDLMYAGFKFDPGIHTLGPGDDIDPDLDLFLRFNLFRPAEGFGLGPDIAWMLIRNSELDNMEFFFNFSADMAFNITGPVHIYGHVPLLGLQFIAYDNDQGNQDRSNLGLNSLGHGFPVELGFFLQF